MTSWDGHKPSTVSALIRAMIRAYAGTATISESQRALFTACEFWAACQNGALSEQLIEADLDVKLQAAEMSFGLIGLPKLRGS